MKEHLKQINNNKGFTLIELMVAFTVFIILVSLSTAIFIETLRSQRMITDITADNESASEALEQISRDVRTGSGFEVVTIGNNQALIFDSVQQGSEVGYILVPNPTGGGGSIARCIGSVCGTDITDTANYEAITPPNVDINSMSFMTMNLSGVPRITILLSVVTPANTKPPINTYFETTISSRNP